MEGNRDGWAKAAAVAAEAVTAEAAVALSAEAAAVAHAAAQRGELLGVGLQPI